MKRTPVIIRIDGKAFHTFTRGMDKPFDEKLMKCMQETTHELVKKIDGCYFGYTQSDEISLLLTDYRTLDTQAWFDYNIQKISSVTSSITTAYFNRNFVRIFEKKDYDVAMFDARVSNYPKEEIVNYFIWRQQDATRNSIQMLGRAHFSQKEMHKKSCPMIQDMLFKEKGINWNDIETPKKRGTAVYYDFDNSEYVIDCGIPIFTQDRDYITKYVNIENMV
jgi:tRNA(His) 5'-end guanylyltransferase